MRISATPHCGEATWPRRFLLHQPRSARAGRSPEFVDESPDVEALLLPEFIESDELPAGFGVIVDCVVGDIVWPEFALEGAFEFDELVDELGVELVDELPADCEFGVIVVWVDGDMFPL